MDATKDEALARLNKLIETGNRVTASYAMGLVGLCSQIPEEELRAFVTSAYSAIEHFSGIESEFFKQLPPYMHSGYIQSTQRIPAAVLGVLLALRDAVEGGYLIRLEMRIRANVEDDFLEQAATLQANGYHVAAMVLIGGVLEDHLRSLCSRRNLTWPGNGALSKYNDALQKTGAYDQPRWRRIQSIADLRNDAAHGGTKAADLNEADVADALQYVRRLLADYSN